MLSVEAVDFEVTRETGSRWFHSALWDCFGARIFNMAANSSSKQSHNALCQSSRPGFPCNLEVANTACTHMRRSEQTKNDMDTSQKKNNVSTAAIHQTVVFIDCAGLFVGKRHQMAISD